MTNETEAQVAGKLADQFDDEGLAVLLARRFEAIEKDPSLSGDLEMMPAYESTEMGLAELRALGWRLVRRWNRELHRLVCGSSDAQVRQDLARALNLGEGTVIAVLMPCLLGIGIPAALAVVLAPIIVRKFLVPAGDELCNAWEEAIGPE
jgi:hypothetical protein